jgi:hypothetical protein
MTVEEVAGRFENARRSGAGFSARCPVHGDKSNSLSIGNGEKGVVLHCFVCGEENKENILAAAGLTFKDLMTNGTNGHAGQPFTIAATYDYRDESGDLLYQILRLQPKTFRARRPDGNGGHVWNLDGISRVLYRLPELLKADPNTDVFVCEGEKDVDALRARGLIATCNPHGAGKWREEYNAHFNGRHIIISPDYDIPGQAHGQDVARHLQGIAASIKVLNLFDGPIPKEHGRDVSDYLADHDVEDLIRLVEAASLCMPAPSITAVPSATPTPTTPPTDLAGVVKAFQHWLYLPDPIPLYATFAVIAASGGSGLDADHRPVEPRQDGDHRVGAWTTERSSGRHRHRGRVALRHAEARKGAGQ